MPPGAVKTIRDLIFLEYAKLICGSALQDRKNYGFVMHNFKKLQSGEKKWSAVLREDLQMDPGRCAYCGGTEGLSGDKDLIAWWGID